MLRDINIGGELAEKYGSKFRFNVKSVGEAIRALNANFPGFRYDIKRNGLYHVHVGDKPTKENALNEETVFMNHRKGDIWILPALEGKKQGGVTAIVGAVLIIAGAVIGYAYGWTGAGWAVGKFMMATGVSMLIGGIMQSDVPQYDLSKDEVPDRRGFLFNGPLNVNEQGGPVRVLYGRMKIGTNVVSTAIDVEDTYYVE